jgi:hypothetical protein
MSDPRGSTFRIPGFLSNGEGLGSGEVGNTLLAAEGSRPPSGRLNVRRAVQQNGARR